MQNHPSPLLPIPRKRTASISALRHHRKEHQQPPSPPAPALRFVLLQFTTPLKVPQTVHVGHDRADGSGGFDRGLRRRRFACRTNPGFGRRLPDFASQSMLYWPMSNALYVEGYALDRFAEGSWALQPVHQNKVGLIFDAGIEEDLQIRHLQVVDAARASLGLPIIECIITDSPLKIEHWMDPTCGKSTGRIQNPNSLLRAVRNLITRADVNAIAVVARFPDDDEIDDYQQGKGVDLLAGVEAIISHLIVKEFHIPCAHAPALSPASLTTLLCPKSAAEEIGYTFLPCVLSGLSNAPQYIVLPNSGSPSTGCLLTADDVDSVVLPIDACRGDGALAFARKSNKALIIAVEENETVLDDTPDKLGIKAVKVSNYWEAVGVIAAHKAGVDPKSLRRNMIHNMACT